MFMLPEISCKTSSLILSSLHIEFHIESLVRRSSGIPRIPDMRQTHPTANEPVEYITAKMKKKIKKPGTITGIKRIVIILLKKLEILRILREDTMLGDELFSASWSGKSS